MTSRRFFSDDDILRVLSSVPQPTSAISFALKCSADAARRRLRRLYDADIIEMKEIPFNTKIRKIYMWSKKEAPAKNNTPDPYIICKQCKRLKPIRDFSTLHGKYMARCKSCNNENHRRNYKLKQLTHELKSKEDELINFKECSTDDKLNQYIIKVQEINKIRKQIFRIKNWCQIRNRERIYETNLSGKISKMKANSKRRCLGFNPINEYFKGSEYHHLRYNTNGQKDDDIGIFIPRDIHRSVPHNGVTGLGMDEMNSIAIKWYNSNGGNPNYSIQTV